MLNADGELAVPLPAVAVSDRVGGKLAEQVDRVVGDGGFAEKLSDGGADVSCATVSG